MKTIAVYIMTTRRRAGILSSMKQRIQYTKNKIYREKIESKMKGGNISCHYCNKSITIGEITVSKAASSYRNHYHIACAEKLNLIN